MATTVTPDTLIVRAPAFASLGKPHIQAAIDEAVRWTNEVNWGADHFNDGILYLACHILTEDAQLAAAGAPQNQGDAVPAGPLQSERILSWSASYAVAEGGVWDDALATTAWGRRYIARRECVFSPRVI